jgi:hypothetical protein
MNCKKAQRIIDEAQHADVLPLEAARHVDACAPCQEFSEGRLHLLGLLASAPRVTAPSNFDIVLQARLAERRDGLAAGWKIAGLWWRIPPAYFRTAGLAAAVLVAVFLGQQILLRQTGNVSPAGKQAANAPLESTPVGSVAAGPVSQPDSVSGNGSPVTGTGVNNALASAGTPDSTSEIRRPVHYTRRHGLVAAASNSDFTATTVGFVLMRGPVAERQMAVPMVSVGSQPLFYASDDSRGLRSARASF